MSMAIIWTAMTVFATLWGAAAGNAEAVGAAAFEGAAAAITLALKIGGAMCLWSGVMEVMRRCGLMESMARFLSPVLRLLFPEASADEQTVQALSANMSANMLGLGNAATPAGVRAVGYMAKNAPSGEASDEICRLVVMNTASVQLLPTTVAAVRSAAGAASAFDILPAVWISSLASVSAGLLCARILEKPWLRRLR